mmetsp:Transcript_3130/g.9594  ORF Transcript_3130/g.9594 Transcript_3130/m.9594 type:complete len:200 (+) Transcript_3130:143-742(+)
MGKGKKRDPNRPKRALTPFMYFSKVRRPQVTEENPNIKFAEVGKRLGEEWKALDEEARKPYIELAEQDKERHKKEMANYEPSAEFSGTKRRDPNRPKRAISAYLCFCREYRESVKAEFPDKQMTDIQKVLGERWNQTTDEEKIPFNQQAQADRRRYDDEMLKFAQMQKATAAAAAAAAAHDEDDISDEPDLAQGVNSSY